MKKRYIFGSIAAVSIAFVVIVRAMAPSSAPNCASDEVGKALLEQIYSRALVDASENIAPALQQGMETHGASVAMEIEVLHQKPLLTIKNVVDEGSSGATFSCRAMIAYKTSSKVRDMRDAIVPREQLRGFEFDPPAGLFSGTAAPSPVDFTAAREASTGAVVITLLAGWQEPVTAAGMLAVNRYMSRALPDLKSIDGSDPADD